MENLIEGSAAPQFEGVTQDGRILSLRDFKGKKLILYFYPKDNTPGCTAESCDLSENYDFWLSKGVDVVVTESPTSNERKKKIFEFIDNLLQKTGKIGEYDQKI